MRGNILKRPCGDGGANSFATGSLWQPLRDEENEESSYFFYISKEELSEFNRLADINLCLSGKTSIKPQGRIS